MWIQDVLTATAVMVPLLRDSLIRDIHLSMNGLIVIFEIDLPDTTRYFYHIKTCQIFRYIDRHYELYQDRKFVPVEYPF